MKYRYRTTLNKPNTSGRCSVIIRVSSGGKRIELYTGITCQKSQWKDRRIKQGCYVNGVPFDILNPQLNNMESFVSDYFNNSAQRSQQASLDDLRERFNSKFKTSAEAQSNEFFFMFQKFIDEVGSQNSWQKDMKDVYTRLLETVKAFKSDISFSDLSIATMESLKKYLSKTLYNDALEKHLTYFKSFVKWAATKKCPIHEEYFSYHPKLKKGSKDVRYLDLSELETIFKLDLSKSKHLERVRDIFIFQCYTGLRISDVRKLKHEDIYKKRGSYRINVLTKKDKGRVDFKLANRAAEMYEKYKDNAYEDGLVFPVISQQKYNDYLKEIGKKAELKGYWIDYRYKLDKVEKIKTPKADLQSHTARRTFISTALNEGMSSDLVAYITSHSDVNSMRPYIKFNEKGTDLVIDAINRAMP